MNPEKRNKIAQGSTPEELNQEELSLLHRGAEGEGFAGDEHLLSELEEALQEGDIISLRSQLKHLSTQTAMTSTQDNTQGTEAYFGLSEEVFNPVNLDLEGQELEIGNYLQQLHIKNHTAASREIVHDLYTEDTEGVEIEFPQLSSEDELLFGEIREAVTEKDILDLRANLRSIGQSTSNHEHSLDEIEDLINGELDEEIARMMREEATGNAALASEIALHGEIDLAVGEKDILKLRSGLAAMMQNEYSHSRSTEEIDAYLSQDLEGMQLADFEAELLMNTGLASDVAFHREIDRASAEGDIIALREQLRGISRAEEERGSQVLGLSPRRKSLLWYAAASSIILMIVFTSLLRNKSYTSQQLYATYYQPYHGGTNVSRSSGSATGAMNTALRQIESGDYAGALGSLSAVPEGAQDGFSVSFYRGVAYQELGEYNRAIGSFSQVVSDGDNLLVEQSQWYIGLCYLRLDERERAMNQFRTIVRGKGFYHGQSKKILQQLE
jgi:tetratricopeptide (TPR) repeat protein